MKETVLTPSLTKLHWACRRGMLELDVLLGNFLNEVYTGLSDEDKQSFINLLSYGDPDLFSWLLGSQKPNEPHLIKITEAIRHHARSRI